MKILARNKKARFNYEIIKTYSAGIELLGSEVKSIKSGGADITLAYAMVDKNNEIQLLNMHVVEYKFQTLDKFSPDRTRKLLLTKKEIKKISQKISLQKLTLVPLELFLNKRGYVKIKIGLAKSLKKYDKRIKEKEKEFRNEKNTYTDFNI